MQNSHLKQLILLLFLSLAVYLRWSAFPETTHLLHHDEAWNWVEAIELGKNPTLVPFFAGNYGRESGWIYWLAIFSRTVGISIFSLRLAASISGLFTVAAIYRLTRNLFGSEAAVGSVGALAVLYWHVHLSHWALRANLFLLLATLVGWLLMQAHRRNHFRDWFYSGIALGLLSYTYFASIVWTCLFV